MLKPEQVPDEVVEAAAKELAYTNGWRNQQGIDVCKPVVLEIIAAAITAWPGAAVCHYTIGDDEGYEMVLPLPFPQETRDDQ